MATDPKKTDELREEQLEEAAGGRIVEVGRPRLEDDATDDAGASTNRMSL